MNLFSGIIVFLILFWTVLFAVLPWGNHAKDVPEEGMAGSAPANPRLKQKFFVTLAISVVGWCIIAGLVHYKVIDFHEISREMVMEDKNQ